MPFGIGRALKSTGGHMFGLSGLLGGGEMPKAPDPYKTAEAQMRVNRDAARMSMVNQNGPFGSLNYTEGPDGRFTATTTLDPAGQAAVGGARQAAGDRLGMFTQNWGSGMPDFSGDRQRIEDELYKRMSSRLDPQYQDRERELTSRLHAQGITQGTEAYQREMDNFGRDRRGAYDEARSSSILGGGAEQSRLFDMSSTQRGQEFGEIGSLFNLGQLNNTPQAVGHAGVGAPDLAGLIGQNYQTRVAGASSQNAALANLLGSGMMLAAL